MSKIYEQQIETLVMELLGSLGYESVYGPDIAFDGIRPERNNYEEVILEERVRKAIFRLNPTIPFEAKEEAVKQIQRLNSPELITNNEAFHRMLTEGISVNYQKDGQMRGGLVWLVDFQNPSNNEYVTVHQFTVIENHHQKRPDVVLFVNGLPVVVIELKNPVDENATLKSAYNQIQTYKQMIPSLFTYNSILVISDGLESKAGTISSDWSRFMAWKTKDGSKEDSSLVCQLETMILGMLKPNTLLDLIRHFIVFETQKKEDKETGLTSIHSVKILASYHQ